MADLKDYYAATPLEPLLAWIEATMSTNQDERDRSRLEEIARDQPYCGMVITSGPGEPQVVKLHFRRFILAAPRAVLTWRRRRRERAARLAARAGKPVRT